MTPEQILNFIGSLLTQGGLLIVIICLGVGEIIKRWIPDEVAQNKYIPIFNGLLGGLIGAFIPSIFPDQPISVCLIYGIILGFASSGIYEGFASLSKKSC